MSTTTLESTFPITFQKDVSKKLSNLLKHHYCVNLVGMKRVGINSFIRYYLNHPDIKKTYLPGNENFLFILVDLNDLIERELYPFWILTQKRIVDSADKEVAVSEVKDRLQTLFLNSIQSKELFLVIDNIRTSIKILEKEGITPVIFFNRFDRLQKMITADLFCNFESLRDTANRKLSFIFTTFRELSNWSKELDRHPSLSLLLDTIYIQPLDTVDAKTALKAYIKPYKVTCPSSLIETLLDWSGRSVLYLRLSTVFLIHHYQEISSHNNIQQIKCKLFKDERILLQSEEIWESLTEKEQTLLFKIVQKQTYSKEEKQAAVYLWNTGIITRNNIFSVFFEQYLMNKIQPFSNENGVKEFSKKEYLLFTLFQSNLNQVVNRGMIIETVWPEEKEFGVSDWAIDRLVARVRMKLKKQKNLYELITVKTRGFKLVKNTHISNLM